MNLSRALTLTSVSTILSLSIFGCTSSLEQPSKSSVMSNQQNPAFYGTLNPYASEPVYFLLTDRFVDGAKNTIAIVYDADALNIPSWAKTKISNGIMNPSPSDNYNISDLNKYWGKHAS